MEKWLYSPLPNSKTLVVWRADKPAILINKGDGVDSAQVAIVLLNHLACPDVPLSHTQEQKAGKPCYLERAENKPGQLKSIQTIPEKHTFP